MEKTLGLKLPITAMVMPSSEDSLSICLSVCLLSLSLNDYCPILILFVLTKPLERHIHKHLNNNNKSNFKAQILVPRDYSKRARARTHTHTQTHTQAFWLYKAANNHKHLMGL